MFQGFRTAVKVTNNLLDLPILQGHHNVLILALGLANIYESGRRVVVTAHLPECERRQRYDTLELYSNPEP